MSAKAQRATPQAELPMPLDSRPRDESAREKHVRGHVVFLDEVLPIVRGVIERVTGKECAQLFDVQPSGLSEALTGTSPRGRETHLEWLVQLLLHAPEGCKLELLTTLCNVAGYKAPERSRPLTESEQLRIYKRYAEKVPGMADLIAKEIEGA